MAVVEYKASVTKDLNRLDPPAARRIVLKIERALSAGEIGAPLTGEFDGLYRLRVGDYRAIYAVTPRGFLVLRIAHRKEVYRRGL